jgi:hypothetical protein
MCIKGGRAGTISYPISAAPGSRFSKAELRVAMEDPGFSMLEVSLDGRAFTKVASPVPSWGRFDLLSGNSARRIVIRFSAENREGGIKPFIKGFVVEGIVE